MLNPQYCTEMFKGIGNLSFPFVAELELPTYVKSGSGHPCFRLMCCFPKRIVCPGDSVGLRFEPLFSRAALVEGTSLHVCPMRPCPLTEGRCPDKERSLTHVLTPSSWAQGGRVHTPLSEGFPGLWGKAEVHSGQLFVTPG